MQWALIWARSGHWHERGLGKGKYCMARFGDKGPYASWNVKIILQSENSSEGNIGKKNMGENNPFYGKKHTVETRLRMSAAQRGKKLSPEHRAKISAAMMGKKHTAEARLRMSAAQRGNKNWLGKKNRQKLATPALLSDNVAVLLTVRTH
jgi:hypothetical protein